MGYSGEVNYDSIINAVDEVGKCSNMLPNKELITANIKTEDVITNTSKTASDAGESQEIFRSMKINDASKTPYSDATQVR